MGKKSKRYTKTLENLDREQIFAPADAVSLVKERATAKFNETIELHMETTVNPQHADQQVRGVVTLPHGTGRQVRILVFTGPDGIAPAEAAGADYVGAEELAEKVQQGWMDFDVVLATPDQMRVVGRLGRVLGPRGMMPSPKAGTIVPANELPRVIDETRKGRVEYRVDKTANIHAPLGKASFEENQILENMAAVMSATVQAKPSTIKGPYIKSVHLTSTMGPSVQVEVNQAMNMKSDA
jgi:large subunit ribosomal protein L1